MSGWPETQARDYYKVAPVSCMSCRIEAAEMVGLTDP